ncbi:MAG: T9SS type A sorting domain-containing protein [Bacteroidia bacterium]
MKIKNYKIGLQVLFLLSTSYSFSQTKGTLTFSFTPVAKSPCYEATKSVMAVWIQTSAGGFVKTKLRYCCNGSTSDHLPTWAVNSGGTASNAGSAACNKTDATTGATLTSFTAKSLTWDGNNVNGTANGTTVADGAYKVTIQETWNHGTTGTATRSFAFTKGSNADHQTPADDANFKTIKLDWVPTSTTGINESSLELKGVAVYPNPSTDGRFNVTFEKANNIKVVNLLGITLYDETIKQTGSTSLDLSSLANGTYIIYVVDGVQSSKHKVILNK